MPQGWKEFEYLVLFTYGDVTDRDSAVVFAAPTCERSRNNWYMVACYAIRYLFPTLAFRRCETLEQSSEHTPAERKYADDSRMCVAASADTCLSQLENMPYQDGP